MQHHKEVWKQKSKLIFILLQLSEMHAEGKVKTIFFKIETLYT